MSLRDLSYSNVYNQQKIIANGSQTANIPGTSVLTTLFTIATQELVTPTARCFMEIGGVMTPLTDGIYVFFNALNSLVVQGQSTSPTTVTIYYRIYKDGKPS